MKKFPDGFYWGAATASYQVEGGIENCDWALAAREDKVPSAGKLADHYNLYEKDFDLALDLGHNAHRFSVEWARIEPEEGVFDEKEIEHYKNVLRALKARNIEPFITIWHFTLPLWFSESGGFERKDSPEIFARYCTKVVEELGEFCSHFSTINEPNVYAGHGWIYGAWPPFKRARLFIWNLGKNDGSTKRVGAKPLFKNAVTYFKVERNLIRAHKSAYTAIKYVSPDTKVSIVKHVRVFESNGNPINILKAKAMQYLQTIRYMNSIDGYFDEIGLNYYRYTKFGDTKNYMTTDMGWKVSPSKIYQALIILNRYKKPIFIAEAGLADHHDNIRADYVKTQVTATWKAIQNGVDVRGHMYWSLMDNYEWALGTEKRFGLIEIDYDSLKRTVRPSAQVYKKIIQNNGIL